MVDFSRLIAPTFPDDGAGLKAVVFGGDAPVIGSELNELQHIALIRQYTTNKLLGVGFIAENVVNTGIANWEIPNLVVVAETWNDGSAGNICFNSCFCPLY